MTDPHAQPPGETRLEVLWRALAPQLDDRRYTFATAPAEQARQVTEPFALVHEKEGVTVICPETEALRLGLRHDGVFRRITLTVHSSLAAVGLTARVSRALAETGIACNVVAGFYHDHLFVPAADAEQAMQVLVTQA